MRATVEGQSKYCASSASHVRVRAWFGIGLTMLLLLSAMSLPAQQLYEYEDLQELTAEIAKRQPLSEEEADESRYHLERLAGVYSDAIDALEKEPEFSGTSAALSDAIAREAARALTASDIAAAYDRFLSAARISPAGADAHELYLRAAAASIELGRHEEALEIAARIEEESDDARIRERASVLGIRAIAFERSREDALERIRRLDPVSPLGLYQWYTLDESPELLERLKSRYGDSLARMLLDGSVRPLLLPSTLLTSFRGQVAGTDKDGERDGAGMHGSVEVSESQAPEVLEEQVEGLQLGSYRNEKYASRHRETLAEYGWEADVLAADDGTHKVVLRFEQPRDRAYAEEQLLKLREEGFEGFVLRTVR